MSRHCRVGVLRVALAAVLIVATACTDQSAPPPPKAALTRPPCADMFTQRGIASWYGRFHHGQRTASGETFDMDGHTAAHRTLPLGTRIQVENLENGRKIIVTVNDRGPYVRGRVLDLSRGAARRLGFVQDGLAPVRINTLCRDEQLEARALDRR